MGASLDAYGIKDNNYSTVAQKVVWIVSFEKQTQPDDQISEVQHIIIGVC